MTDSNCLIPLQAFSRNMAGDRWSPSLRYIRELNAQVRRAITGFPEDRLDDPPVEEPRCSA